MNYPPPPDPNALFNLEIAKWNMETYATDTWINNPRNDRGPTAVYEFNTSVDTVPYLTGDRPWVGHANTLFAKIRCEGPQDARDVLVTAYTCSPPGIGDGGVWEAIDTKAIPLIRKDSHEIVI